MIQTQRAFVILLFIKTSLTGISFDVLFNVGVFP